MMFTVDFEIPLPHQQPVKPLIQPEKPSKQSVVSGTEGMSSAIASLFESRHPWTKEGSLENSYGFGGFSSGGLLGIRGSMPRLPSFKVTVVTCLCERVICIPENRR